MIQADLNEAGRIPDDDIAALIKNHDTTKYKENELYYKGLNPTILKWNTKDEINSDSLTAYTDQVEDIAPNNKIPVPYGRKIALTTKNYMFAKPVSYTAENKDYIERLSDVLFVNQNDEKVNKIGLSLIVHGVAYKLFYQDVVAGKTVPKYTVVDSCQIIPIYSNDIEPVMVCAIRHYMQTKSAAEKKPAHKVEVYYADVMVKADFENNKIANSVDVPYTWGRIPVVPYGDADGLGVFDPVKKIIDAIDVVVSADVNEIQRFEMLYMILIGDRLPDDDFEVQKMVKRRIFELSKEAQMSYLERNVDFQFNKHVKESLEKLMHKMSGVPDFEGPEFAAESGIALLYKLMGFENIASQVEATFKRGEQDSIDMINVLMEGATDKYAWWAVNRDKQVDIRMYRNMPEDVNARLTEATAMKALGVSMETILDYIPTLKNTAQEMERIEGERKKNFEAFQSTMIPAKEEPEDDKPGTDDKAVQ